MRRLALTALPALVTLSAACKDPAPAKAPPPAAATEGAMCAEHGVLEAVCTKCNPKLSPVFQAKGDWCPEHGFPMSFCPIHYAHGFYAPRSSINVVRIWRLPYHGRLGGSMRLLGAVAVVTLVSPFGGCVSETESRLNKETRDNHLLSRPSALADLRPASDRVLVLNVDKLVRVSLDGRTVGLVDASPVAITADGATRLHLIDQRYVIRGAHAERVVEGVEAILDRPVLSPDGKLAAVAAAAHTRSDFGFSTSQLVIISLADAGVRRFAVGLDVFSERVWEHDSSALHVGGYRAPWRRIDLASGEVTESKGPIEARADVVEVRYPERGFRLVIDHAGKRQRIVHEPITTAKDPENLSSLSPRVLIEAEGLAPTMLRNNPSELRGLSLTPSCDHFVFDFGGWVFVGDTDAGRFAPLIRGSVPR